MTEIERSNGVSTRASDGYLMGTPLTRTAESPASRGHPGPVATSRTDPSSDAAPRHTRHSEPAATRAARRYRRLALGGGLTTLYLSLIVLIPLAAVVYSGTKGGWRLVLARGHHPGRVVGPEADHRRQPDRRAAQPGLRAP